MSYGLSELKTADGVTVVRSWRCDCWHCNPTKHTKPQEVIEREQRERAERPKMPDEIKEALRERTRQKAEERKLANQRKRAIRLQEKGIDPTPDRLNREKRGDALTKKYGPTREIKKFIEDTPGGAVRALLVCGHNKTIHHRKQTATRCRGCRS